MRLLTQLGGAVREDEGIVYVWPKDQRRHAPLTLRLLVLSDGRKPIYLLTNVLDPARLAEAQAAAFYRRRWHIELFFRGLKQTLGKRTLRSDAPVQAALELRWAVLGLALLGLWGVQALAPGAGDVRRLSLAVALRHLRVCLADPTRRCPRRQRLAVRLARARQDAYRRKAPKVSGHWPHKKNEPPAGAPKINPATPAQRAAYQEQRRQRNLNVVAVQRLAHLERWFAAQGERRPRWVVVDNRLTNRTVLRAKPAALVLLGRIRKDAKLYSLPGGAASPQQVYGPAWPTPAQIRQDEALPWQTVRADAAGKVHAFRVTVVRPVRWWGMGRQNLMRVVLAPLGYRWTKNGKILYRQPAYLICTDPQAAVAPVVRAYLWRWGLEVNFRDEKTLLGLGQAQVRAENSVRHVPAVAVGAYGLLPVAALQAWGPTGPAPDVPTPAWQKHRPPPPAGTMPLIQQLRHECWSAALTKAARTDFMGLNPGVQKSEVAPPPLDSAVFCAIAG